MEKAYIPDSRGSEINNMSCY